LVLSGQRLDKLGQLRRAGGFTHALLIDVTSV
jgi:hypothetical protein